MQTEFLMELLQTVSVSGQEEAIQRIVKKEAQKFAGQVITDEMGDVTACLNPDHPCKILLSAHADEIGLRVTHITESGRLKVVKSGGIYPGMYFGHKVRVITEKGIVKGAVANHFTLWKTAEKEVRDITIDIGADSGRSARELAEVGDCVVFDTDASFLHNDMICGRALDDKLGVFIIMEALREAAARNCTVGAYAASTVGEETTKTGAYWVANRVKPTCYLAVDVTYASDCDGVMPGDNGSVVLGGGPVLCVNNMIHKGLNHYLKKAARRASVQIQTEVTSGLTCTDADRVHFSLEGVPTALVSIPLRYMHTPAEMASLKDVEACIHLLTEFLCMVQEGLDLDPFTQQER